MNPNPENERLEFLLALLPKARQPAQLPPSADLLEGLLCGAICADRAEDPVSVLDAHWGEDWAESLVEQELLDELMAWLEERWQSLQEALNPDLLRQDPDALPLAEVLPWASSEASAGDRQRLVMPDAARLWARGFLASAERVVADPAGQELLDVVAALTLEPGPSLQAYLQRAYEQTHEADAAALIDDALFAAQDLRLASIKALGH